MKERIITYVFGFCLSLTTLRSDMSLQDIQRLEVAESFRLPFQQAENQHRTLWAASARLAPMSQSVTQHNCY